jgi:hypothetical protein
MGVTVQANPQQLSWDNFREVASLTNGEDAHIDVGFDISVANPRQIGGQWALAETFTITVTPRAKVLSSASKTAALLAHEQVHYDIGLLAGRAMGRALAAIRTASREALRTALNDTFTLHGVTRMGAIQVKYDTDTNHSAIATEQTRWRALTTAGLAATQTDTLDGLPV